MEDGPVQCRHWAPAGTEILVNTKQTTTADRVVRHRLVIGAKEPETAEIVGAEVEAGTRVKVEVEVGPGTGTEVGPGAEVGVVARIETTTDAVTTATHPQDAIADRVQDLVPDHGHGHGHDHDHDLLHAVLANTVAAVAVAVTIIVVIIIRVVVAVGNVHGLLAVARDPPLIQIRVLQIRMIVIIAGSGAESIVAKSKKEKKNQASKAYGTFGILTAADMWNKENEFQAWLMEVKKLDPEKIPQNQMKQHFIGFMEDYNTVTMPHEKFYNLTKWEERQRAIRMGEPLPESQIGAVNLLNDEEQLRMKQRDRRKLNVASNPVLMTQSQVQELRRVQHERVEADRLRKMGFDAGRKGVRYE
ncbi:hypothetical protein BGZ94_004061 [Podila epigama]|nr:hypothetical protein BGZ94_004061 [Podila epigama]